MSFETINPDKIKVGDPITSDLLSQIKNNFDNHELRISNLSESGGTVFIFNGDVSLVNYSPSRSDIFYYTARQDFSIFDFRVRLFTKDSISSGVLSFRLEKSNDPNNDNFATILTSDIEFDFATDVDYSEKIALLNTSENDITTGQILRIKVTNVPSGFIGKILLSIGAQ